MYRQGTFATGQMTEVMTLLPTCAAPQRTAPALHKLQLSESVAAGLR